MVRAVQLAAEQLRRAANSGERVLDLMRQDRGTAQQPAFTARRIIGQGFDPAQLVQAEHLPARLVDNRREVDVKPPYCALPAHPHAGGMGS